MREIFGRIFLIIISAILLFQFYPTDINTVGFSLIGIIFGMFSELFAELVSTFEIGNYENIIYEICMSLYIIIAFIFPQLIFFTPAWAMCAFSRKLKVGNILCLLSLIYGLLYYRNPLFLLVPLLAATGVIIENLAISNVEFDTSIKRERDLAKEYEMILEEKNRVLTENQDNKIYTATLQERNRIAREIHDNVGHMLTRSILQIGAIKVINKDESLSPLLNDLHTTLDTAMNNIRSSVHDLHDESIDLHSAVMDIKESITDFNITVDYGMSDIVPREIKYAFIAIIKEATNNSIKHSNGNKIDIILKEQPGFYQLSIGDNGTSIPLNYNSGIGLTTINERVKNIHGNIKITTDNGFRILITVIK